MEPKIKNLLIYALFFVATATIKEAIAFPMESGRIGEEKKSSSLTPQAAIEQKRRASESSNDSLEENDGNLTSTFYPLLD